MSCADFQAAIDHVGSARLYRCEGAVVRIAGLAIESDGPPCEIGEECLITHRDGRVISRAQVTGFSGNRVFSMPLERLSGVGVGARVVALGRRPQLVLGEHLLGRVLDADGNPLDGRPLARAGEVQELERASPTALSRQRIDQPFETGIRSIDALLTLGRGQRIGVFAGSGVGKSTLLGMLARHSQADVAVIALVGERGREVRDFLETNLGEEGLRHAVVFVSTADEPPLRRIRAALAATATAEYFRRRKCHVALLMDSITRVAMAQREVGLSMGEPPSTKGYPPSVFALLPRLLERAGNVVNQGSITGLYTVYIEGDDINDPVGDAARSLLDGHVVLSRELADRGHFPAVDVLGSVSRLMPQVSTNEHRAAAVVLRRWLSSFRKSEDLVLLGAYREGTDPDVDAALRERSKIESLLTQGVDERATLEETLNLLGSIVSGTATA